MALDWLKKFSIKQETRSFYIARPPEYAERLIYLHPDRSVPRGAKLTVRSDECALFFREGKLIGKIDTGTYLLDTANLPFLGHLIVDEFTNANHFICELFFVTTREWAQSFEDVEVGQFRDSNSRNVVKVLASFGYTVRIADPARLIIGLGGAEQGIAGANQRGPARPRGDHPAPVGCPTGTARRHSGCRLEHRCRRHRPGTRHCGTRGVSAAGAGRHPRL